MEQNYQDWHQTILSTAVELTGSEDDGRTESFAGLKEMTVEILKNLRTAMYPHIFSDDKDGRRHSDTCVLSLQTAFVLLQQALLPELPGCGGIDGVSDLLGADGGGIDPEPVGDPCLGCQPGENALGHGAAAYVAVAHK